MAETLSRRQVAKLLGISPLTLYRWEREGKSPGKPQRLVRNGYLIYSRDDVEAIRAWMNRTVEADFGQGHEHLAR